MSTPAIVRTPSEARELRADGGAQPGRGGLWQRLMFAFCVCFGLALIAQTQAAGDGGWFWYATFLKEGQRLYSQMHLALQPLFVLETEWFLRMFGPGWIASKIPAVVHLVAYCMGLYLLVRRSGLTDAQKAVVFGCGFFFPLGFEAYRFDDYHVLADCFQLFSLVALFALSEAERRRKVLALATALGALCGLSMTTRLNDGAALFVGAALGVLVLARRARAVSLLLLGLSTFTTVVLVVHLTGDSLHDYATYSIFRAAGSKGGAGSVLHYPLMLPVNTVRWLLTYRANDIFSGYIFLCALGWARLVRPLWMGRGRRELTMASGGALLILLPLLLPWVRSGMFSLGAAPSAAVPLVSIGAMLTLLTYLLGALIVVRLLRGMASRSEWNRREILLLVPIGQLASGSMSSGGSHLGLYGPIGVLLVLLSIVPPFHVRVPWLRSFATAVATILVATTAMFKYKDPYSWHTYRERPLFEARTVYRHPVYGPMVIDRDLLAMIEPVCGAMRGAGPQTQLLSLPFSYSNYFCGTPPWEGYVQTFFDTSTKETIEGLMDKLQGGPPEWIFYQRQMATLELHERIYNHGQPLEHRYLDEIIEQKIAAGEWRVVYTSSYGDSGLWDNHWMLIRTRR